MVLSIMVGCGNTVRNVSSSYRQGGISVDSSLNDWGDQLTHDPGSKLFYGVSHDDHYLYLALQSRDPVVQRKIMAFGLTLWLDPTGKKEKDKGIRYPVPRKENIPVAESEEDEALPLRARRARPQDTRRYLQTTDKKHLQLLHFDDQDKQQLDVEESEDIRVSIHTEASHGVSYEVRIPFSKIYDHARSGEQELSIGFVTGHLDVPDRSGSRGSRGAMIPYGGSRRDSGRANGASQQLEQFSESTELWLKGIEISGP